MTDLKTIASQIKKVDKRKSGSMYKFLKLLLEAYEKGFEDGRTKKIPVGGK